MHKQVFHQTGHQLPGQLTNLYFNQKTGKEEVGIPPSLAKVEYYEQIKR